MVNFVQKSDFNPLPIYNWLTVKLPNLKVELPPLLADVIELIIASKDQGISRPQLLDAGLTMGQLKSCLLLLKIYGAIIHSRMKEGRTRQGHMSPRVIHYTFIGWRCLECRGIGSKDTPLL